MDLTGLSLLDAFGTDRIPLTGKYTHASLAKEMVKEWVPFFECHKCGRWDYCKYAKPHPANGNRSIDIQCGVAVRCIGNLVKWSFKKIQGAKHQEIQSFLDGAFHFSKFILRAEEYIGMNMDEGFHRYFGDSAHLVYSNIGHLRNHLIGVATHWSLIPYFSTKSAILFVEGYSEKAFLDEMKKSHLAWFLDIQVEVYGGKGNRKSKRIQMLWDKYQSQGVVVFVQGDADGNSENIFANLVSSGSVGEERTFVFKYDFETSIPIGILHQALTEMELIPAISTEVFRQRIGNFSESITSRLQKVYNLDIGPYKMELATTVGSLLNGTNWWGNDRFTTESELGQFLLFVTKVK